MATAKKLKPDVALAIELYDVGRKAAQAKGANVALWDNLQPSQRAAHLAVGEYVRVNFTRKASAEEAAERIGE